MALRPISIIKEVLKLLRFTLPTTIDPPAVNEPEHQCRACNDEKTKCVGSQSAHHVDEEFVRNNPNLRTGFASPADDKRYGRPYDAGA
jgi:hypothetical protein